MLLHSSLAVGAGPDQGIGRHKGPALAGLFCVWWRAFHWDTPYIRGVEGTLVILGGSVTCIHLNLREQSHAWSAPPVASATTEKAQVLSFICGSGEVPYTSSPTLTKWEIGNEDSFSLS